MRAWLINLLRFFGSMLVLAGVVVFYGFTKSGTWSSFFTSSNPLTYVVSILIVVAWFAFVGWVVYDVWRGMRDR